MQELSDSIHIKALKTVLCSKMVTNHIELLKKANPKKKKLIQFEMCFKIQTRIKNLSTKKKKHLIIIFLCGLHMEMIIL